MSNILNNLYSGPFTQTSESLAKAVAGAAKETNAQLAYDPKLAGQILSAPSVLEAIQNQSQVDYC